MSETALSVIASQLQGESINTKQILDRAKRDWYNDDDTGKPFQVWVLMNPNQEQDILSVIRTPDFRTGDKFWVWRCERRIDLVRLVAALAHFHQLSYLGIGIPRCP